MNWRSSEDMYKMKEARCKADQSTLMTERDELLGKVKVLQDKINAHQCQ